VFFHGSGFVLCSLDTHDGMCRNLCAGSMCVVASVDYRLAPEHKFPAGIDDCLHATIKLGVTRTRPKSRHVRMNDESEHEEDRACDRRLETSVGGIGR